jgi:hypothetical protein
VRRWPFFTLAALLCAAPRRTLEPPQPVLAWIYPAGGRQGTTVEVTLSGTSVEPQSVIVTGDGVRARVVDGTHVAVEIASDAPLGARELRVLNAGGVSNRARFMVGDLPEIAEPASVESLPVIVNGQILEGERDRFRVHAIAGQEIVAEVQARALRPYIADAVPGWFDPILAIYDADGHQLLYADDFRSDPDPSVVFRAPRDGDYTVEVRDVIYRGRGDFVYRLRLGGSQSLRDFADPTGTIGAPGEIDTFPVRAAQGDRLVFEVQARRFGSPLDSILTLLDERGRSVAENDDWTDPEAGLIAHQADSRIAHTFAAPGNYTLRLRDVQGKGGPDYAYRLLTRPPNPDFALRVAPDNPRVGQGQTTVLTVSAVRRDDFAAEIRLGVEGLPPGFVASEGRIAAGHTEGRLTITAPDDAPIGVLSPVIVGTTSIGRRVAVPCEAAMQAFAYTHYLPSDRLFVAVVPATAFTISTDGEGAPPAGRDCRDHRPGPAPRRRHDRREVRTGSTRPRRSRDHAHGGQVGQARRPPRPHPFGDPARWKPDHHASRGGDRRDRVKRRRIAPRARPPRSRLPPDASIAAPPRSRRTAHGCCRCVPRALRRSCAGSPPRWRWAPRTTLPRPVRTSS